MKLDVVCLCAQWCGTCRDYLSEFEALVVGRPDWRAHWIDIEDHEASLDKVDITTFPMILIVNAAGSLCFAGPIAPQPGMLLRLCQAAQRGALRITDDEAMIWRPLMQSLCLRNE